MPVYSSFKFRYEVGEAEELVGIVPHLSDLIEHGETLKVDRAASVTRVIFENQDLIIKRYTARSVWHSIKRSMRCSRARNAWNASIAFSNAGIAVPSALIYVEKRLGFLRLDSYLVYRAIEGESLLEVLPIVEGVQRRALIEQIAILFEKMRTGHLVHGDMKATNLMVVDGQIVVIDLDVARPAKAFFDRAHARDQRRFLKNWVGNNLLYEELATQIKAK